MKPIVFKFPKKFYEMVMNALAGNETAQKMWKTNIQTHLRVLRQINEVIEWADNRWNDIFELQRIEKTLPRLRDALIASGKRVKEERPHKMVEKVVDDTINEAVAFHTLLQDRIKKLRDTASQLGIDTSKAADTPAWLQAYRTAKGVLHNTHAHFTLHSRTSPENLHLFVPLKNDGKAFQQIIVIPENDSGTVLIGRWGVKLASLQSVTLSILAATRKITEPKSAFSFSQLMRIENNFRLPAYVRKALDEYFAPFEKQTQVASVDTAAMNPAIIFRNLRDARVLWKKAGGFPDGEDRLQFLKLLVGVFAALDSKFFVWMEVALEGYQQFKKVDTSEGVVNPELMQNNDAPDGTFIEKRLLDEEEKRKKEEAEKPKAPEHNPPKKVTKVPPEPEESNPKHEKTHG